MTVYCFDDFRFNAKDETLCRGDEEISVRPQTAQLLALLITHQGRPVSKEELVEAVWGDAFVNDQAIFQSINQLRKALGENARKPKYLKTVPRKGYQWICETREEAPQPVVVEKASRELDPNDTASITIRVEDPPAEKKGMFPILWKWLIPLAALVILAVLFRPKPQEPLGSQTSAAARLAILPFSNETGDPEKQWIELGLMDMVAQTFSLNRDADAIGAERILKAMKDHRIQRGEALSATQLDRLKSLLGADWVISAAVTNKSGGFHLTYKAYGGGRVIENKPLEAATLAGLAQEFERQVNQLVEKGDLRTKYEVFSSDPFVNESYAQGLQLHYKSEYARAMPYFEVCLHKDPHFLWAGYRLARAKANLADMNGAEILAQSLLQKARTAKDQPLEAEVLTLLGDVALGRDDVAGQVRSYSQALELWRALKDGEKESRLMVDLAAAYGEQGRIEDAEALFKGALAMAEKANDGYRVAMTHDMWGLMALGEDGYEAARARWETAYGLWRKLAAWEEAVFTLVSIGQLSEQLEKWDHALSVLKEALVLVEEQQLTGARADVLSALGSVCRDSGKLDEATVYLKQALETAAAREDFGALCMIGLELADLKLKREDRVGARQAAEEALDQSLKIGYALMETDIRLFLAELDLAERRYEAAWDQVNKTMTLSPDYSEPHLVAARIEKARNNCAGALATLRKMKEKWPRSWDDEAASIEKHCLENQ